MSEDHRDAPPSAGPLHIFLLSRDPKKLRGIHHVRELAPDEDTAYRDASRHLQNFKRSRELFPLVQLNARAVIKGAATIIGAPREKLRDTRTREHLGREFNRLIVNYLGSFRLYLDQMRTRLSDLYKTQSTEFAAFEAARTHAFDTTPEYRIVYKARDFVLHCGMLVSGVQFSEGLSPGPEPKITHTVAVDCGRESLLERFGKEWRHAYADIQTQPESFPIHLMFVAATRALYTVDTRVMEAERPSLLASARVIVGLVDGIATKEGEGVGVGQLERDGPRTNIKFVHAPAGVIGWLGLPYERIVQF